MGNRVLRRLSVLFVAFLLLSLLAPTSSQAAPLVVEQRKSSAVGEHDPDRRLLLAKLTPEAMRAAEPLDLSLTRSQLDLDSFRLGASSSGPPVSEGPAAPRSASSSSLVRAESLALAGPIPFERTEITNTSDYPNRAHGKLFIFEGSDPAYACSATVVNSPTKNVVWTAGHCVHDGGPRNSYFDDFAFVPGYRNGHEPFDVWFAGRALTTDQWRESTRENVRLKYDVAALVMESIGGNEIADVVGARGIRFNENPDQLYDSFGYPVDPPFNGERLWLCDSDPGIRYGSGDLAFMGIGCDMNGGSSGGGWIANGGFVQSVNSFGFDGDPRYEDVMFGPQMRDDALEVYDSAVVAGGPDTTAPKLTKVADGPDPFTPLGPRNRKTNIRFTLDERTDVTLMIKSSSGTTVARLPESPLQVGGHKVRWNGRHFKSGKVVKAGAYTYKIVATDLSGNTSSKSGKVRVKR